MKKMARPILALVAMVGVGTSAYAGTWGDLTNSGWGGSPNPTPGVTVPVDQVEIPQSTFGNASYGAQMSFDSFRYSVRKRMETMRIGTAGQPFGSPFSRSTTYSSRNTSPSYNAGGGYYNQNYNGQVGQAPQWTPPAGQYNQQWNPPALPAAPNSYNAPSSYSPYGATTNYGGQMSQPYSYNGSFASDSAYAMAPSSRTGTYSSASRRMLDCVYYSGFTVWGDLYQTWAKQKSRGNDEGYRYRTTGPAIGVDWTNGPVTVGLAMTYNWGKLRGRDIDHSIKLDTWAVDLYAQYNAQNWYVNGSLAYAHNRFKSDRTQLVRYNNSVNVGSVYNHTSFSSNSWNLDIEYGWKLDWKGIQVIPNVGLRYFHDRRGGFTEDGANLAIKSDGRNYHVLDVPIGVNFAYEIASAGRVFVPRARVAWIPELARKAGSSTGEQIYNNAVVDYSESGARRNRHGFLVGLGLEARLSKSLSAHIDYNCNFRSKQYEHHWNLGAAFTF